MHKGKVVLAVRALYGLKGAVSAWRSTLRKLIHYIIFNSYRSDGYVWAVKAVDA